MVLDGRLIRLDSNAETQEVFVSRSNPLAFYTRWHIGISPRQCITAYEQHAGATIAVDRILKPLYHTLQFRNGVLMKTKTVLGGGSRQIDSYVFRDVVALQDLKDRASDGSYAYAVHTAHFTVVLDRLMHALNDRFHINCPSAPPPLRCSVLGDPKTSSRAIDKHRISAQADWRRTVQDFITMFAQSDAQITAGEGSANGVVTDLRTERDAVDVLTGFDRSVSRRRVRMYRDVVLLKLEYAAMALAVFQIAEGDQGDTKFHEFMQ